MSKFRILREIVGSRSQYFVQRLVESHPDDRWEDIKFWVYTPITNFKCDERHTKYHDILEEAEFRLFQMYPPKPVHEVVREYNL